MGWTAKTGTLEPGKWADILAVEANPLEDVRVLQEVKSGMKLGVGPQRQGTREELILAIGQEEGRLCDALQARIAGSGSFLTLKKLVGRNCLWGGLVIEQRVHPF